MTQTRIPSYRLHKATGQAVVVHKGRSEYLGKFGTPESRVAYDRVVAGILSAEVRRRGPAVHRPKLATKTAVAGPPLLVSELILRTGSSRPATTSRTINRPANSIPSSPHSDCSAATVAVSPSPQSAPSCFGSVQQAMIREPVTRRVKVTGPDDTITFETKVVRVGLARRTINKQIGRIKRVFRWAVAEELLPPEVYAAIREAPGLKKNRSAAREKARVRPVAASTSRRPWSTCRRRWAAMARVQWLCGCRPQEVVLMRACDIDRTGPVWEYRPPVYKTDHVNDNYDEALERVVFLGPRAQAEIEPLLAAAHGGYLFQAGPVSPPATANRRRERSRAPGAAEALQCGRIPAGGRRGCRRAGVPVWSPNQLRHAAATCGTPRPRASARSSGSKRCRRCSGTANSASPRCTPTWTVKPPGRRWPGSGDSDSVVCWFRPGSRRLSGTRLVSPSSHSTRLL